MEEVGREDTGCEGKTRECMTRDHKGTLGKGIQGIGRQWEELQVGRMVWEEKQQKTREYKIREDNIRQGKTMEGREGNTKECELELPPRL